MFSLDLFLLRRVHPCYYHPTNLPHPRRDRSHAHAHPHFPTDSMKTRSCEIILTCCFVCEIILTCCFVCARAAKQETIASWGNDIDMNTQQIAGASSSSHTAPAIRTSSPSVASSQVVASVMSVKVLKTAQEKCSTLLTGSKKVARNLRQVQCLVGTCGYHNHFLFHSNNPGEKNKHRRPSKILKIRNNQKSIKY